MHSMTPEGAFLIAMLTRVADVVATKMVLDQQGTRESNKIWTKVFAHYGTTTGLVLNLILSAAVCAALVTFFGPAGVIPIVLVSLYAIIWNWEVYKSARKRHE